MRSNKILRFSTYYPYRIKYGKYVEHRRNRINMKATGIVRRIDDLGRIVVRRKSGARYVSVRVMREIFTDREGEIILKNTHRLGKWEILQTNMRKVWHRRLISGVYHRYRSGDRSNRMGRKEFQEQLITRQLAEVIAKEGSSFWHPLWIGSSRSSCRDRMQN